MSGTFVSSMLALCVEKLTVCRMEYRGGIVGLDLNVDALGY